MVKDEVMEPSKAMESNCDLVGEEFISDSLFRKLSNFNSFVGMAVAGFQKEISFCLRKMEARKGHGVKASGKEETFTIILF